MHRSRTAGRSRRATHAFFIQKDQRAFAFDSLEGYIGRIRQAVIAVAIHCGPWNRRLELGLQCIA